MSEQFHKIGKVVANGCAAKIANATCDNNEAFQHVKGKVQQKITNEVIGLASMTHPSMLEIKTPKVRDVF